MVNHEEGTRDESSQSEQITKMHAHTESYIVTPLGEQTMRKFNTNAKLLRPGNQQYVKYSTKSASSLFINDRRFDRYRYIQNIFNSYQCWTGKINVCSRL